MSKVKERLESYGVKLVGTNPSFVEQNEEVIENLLFINRETSLSFKLAMAHGFKEMRISERSEISSSAIPKSQFVFVSKCWLMLADLNNERLLLFKTT